MLVNKYQEETKRTLNTKLTDKELLSNMALGIAGEGGEITDIIKKHLYQGHELNQFDLFEEVGDILWYISNLCNVSGFTMEDVMNYNIAKLKKRFPEGFSEERSINR